MKTLRVLLLGSVLALLSSPPVHAALDVLENGGTGDGISDVWQLKHQMNGISPTADSDGDGATNANEAGAGTDPWTPSNIVKVTSLEITNGNVILTWPSVLGKRYRVQKTTTLSNPNSWTTVTEYVNGTDGPLTETTPAISGTVYRVAVYDMDTDGDGLSDWEERQLGLDPENDRSHGLGGQPDLAWATAAVKTTPAQQIITFEAPEPYITENGYGSSILVKRSAGLAPLTVKYTISGSATPGATAAATDADYETLSGTVVIPFGASSAAIPIKPFLDSRVESNEAVILTLAPDPAYTIGQPAAGSVIINDFTSATGTGITAEFWNEIGTGANAISDTNPAKFAGAPLVTRIDETINYSWPDNTTQGSGSPAVGINTNYFSCRWTGEVLPQFSQIYTFELQVNRAGRLWVNGQLLINNWPPATVGSNTYSGVIALEAGKRYPIVVEHYETTSTAEAMLRWSSANLPEEVVPKTRLFPAGAPTILSSLESLTFVGGPAFSYQITASGNPTSYSVGNLPPGLTLNATTGLITGSPTQSGTWQVTLTATNNKGSGSAILNMTVLQTGGGIVREKWTSLTGTSVASIPLGTPPANSSTLTSLQSPANDGDNYGARIRGYLTAPTTGVYQFWLAADDAAELYIADDAEPANSWLRASLTTGSSAAPDWSTAAKSPLLYLKASTRYYIEVRHKEGTGSDHLAIGWSKPGQPTTAPSEIVPGYVLTQYTPPAPTAGTSTLFITSMSAQAGALTNGYGSASLQLSADKTEAIVRFTHANLTGPVAQKHVHSGADGGLILFDMDVTPPNPDGSFTWHIQGVPGVSDKDGDSDSDAADIVKLIENGDAYINLHTALYPAGEVKGFYRLAQGSQTFVPPPAVPDWTADTANAVTTGANAARFLQQATFGPSEATIAEVTSLGYEGWINAQFAKPTTLHFPVVYANRNTTNPQNATYVGDLVFNAWWRQSITAQDQLRQRVAFALSQILVVSEAGPLDDRGDALSDYYDMLLAGHLDPAAPENLVNPVVNPIPLKITGITGYDGGATLKAGVFGNFRDILLATTLHPAMGRYLDMLRNDKPNISTGRIPNENYAREILQLFSIGLNRLHPDGSLVLDSAGLPVPTYDQDAVIGFSHVFTGWDYNYTGAYRTALNAGSNWIEPMREVPVRHYTGQKRLLNNVVIPGLPVLNGVPLDPNASHPAATYNDPTYQALAAQELLAAHDQIFNHPNIGPFICRQLIQRLVTSTPSRGYIYRVVQKFNNNGAGVRGDMQAVIKAILLDYEARSTTAAGRAGYGKQREPLLRVTEMARAFPPNNALGGTWQQDGGAISIRTSSPHRLASGQTMTLEFGGTTPPGTTPLITSGSYTQSTLGGAVPMTANEFGVRPRDVIRGTYAQAANTVTITAQANHGFTTNHRAYVRFRDGALTTSNGLYPVTVTSATAFTITVPTSGTATGACDISFLRGGYSMAQPAAGVTTGTCTFTTNTIHGLANNANVYIDFVLDTTNNGSFSPVDGMHTITVTSPTSFTVTATYPAAAPANTGTLSNDFNAAAQAPVLDRGGHAAGFAVTTGYQDFTMGSTDTDLSQTPLRSPTVFNFFLPDYQYPGELAQAGLITPEFELTSDTTVIRQANFLYNGLFNPNYTTGLSSFKSGAADIVLDYSKWMDIRPGSTNPWTDNSTTAPANDNLRNLIRELAKLLMAGQISTAMENEIYAFVSNNTTSGGNPNGNIVYTNGTTNPFATATTTELTHRRDRLRAVIHLIVTSPEFSIQK